MRNLKKLARIVKSYALKTWRNKALAVALVIIGYLSVIPDNDGTAFVFVLFLAIPLFFATKDVAEWGE